MDVYVVMSEIFPFPNNRWTVQGVYSNEYKAWESIEKIFYKHLNFLQTVGNKIKAIAFDVRCVYIIYYDNLKLHETKFTILKRKFDE